MAQQRRPRVCREHHRLDRSAWRWRHLEATDALGTTWKPSPTGGPSIAVAGCAGGRVGAAHKGETGSAS